MFTAVNPKAAARMVTAERRWLRKRLRAAKTNQFIWQ
jgi:hypothetical protein